MSHRFRLPCIVALALLASTAFSQYDTAGLTAWGGYSFNQTASGNALVTGFAVGMQHSLIRREDGTMLAWGVEPAGIGQLPNLAHDIVQVSAGDEFSLALHADGTVWAGGINDHGQATVPAGLTGVKYVNAGHLTALAVKTDGTVVGWGDNAYGERTIPSGLTGVVAVASGWYHSLALKSDGTVVAWGNNTYGQCNVPAGLTGVVQISCNRFHNVALKSDGTIVTWGTDHFGEMTIPTSPIPYVQIATNQYLTMALRADGTVVCAGQNDYNQINVPYALQGVQMIGAGYKYCMAMKGDRSIVAWGNVPYPAQPPSGMLSQLNSVGINQISDGWALRGDGTLAPFLPFPPLFINPYSGLTDVAQITGNFTNAVAVHSSGQLTTIGNPIVPTPTNAIQADAVGTIKVAVTATGGISATGITVPAGTTNITEAAAGSNFVVARKSVGTAIAFGNNSSGQTNVPITLINVLHVYAGGMTAIALENDGSLVGWGDNSNGQLNFPAGLGPVSSLTIGSGGVIAVMQDGTLVGWGTTVPTPPAVSMNNMGQVVYRQNAYGLQGLTLFNNVRVDPNYMHWTMTAWLGHASTTDTSFNIVLPTGTPLARTITAGGHFAQTFSPQNTPGLYTVTYQGQTAGSVVFFPPEMAGPVSSFLYNGTVLGGNSTKISVKLNLNVHTGGGLLRFNCSPNVEVVPDAVQVPANQTTVVVNVYTNPVGVATTGTVTAYDNEGSTTCNLNLNPVYPASLNFYPATLVSGGNTTATVALNVPAPPTGLTMLVSGMDQALPAVQYLYFPPGAQVERFNVRTAGTPGATSGTVNLQFNGASLSNSFTIRPAIAQLSSLTFYSSTLQGNGSTTGVVTLATAATAGGQVVSLNTSVNCINLPSSVTVPSGATTAHFTITANPQPSDTTTTITASSTGANAITNNLKVLAPKVSSVSLNPTSVTGGTTSTGTVNLNNPAPPGGLVVTLHVNNDFAVTDPNVTVPEGATSATFTVQTVPVTATQTSNVGCSVNGSGLQATLTITP